MKKELHTTEVENKTEQTKNTTPCQKINERDILETNDITLEEVAIDGICGVY